MLEINCDLWDFDGYKAITTNGIVKPDGRLVMGAGVAKQARERYKDIDAQLGAYVKKWGNRCFILPKWQMISFPTKEHFRDLSSFSLIEQSCRQAMEIADKYKIKKVGMTRPGCGNGGRSWDVIKKLIEPLLDDRFTICDVDF